MTPLRLSLPAPVTGRLGAIGELKGMAILMVIAYHALGVLGVANRIHGEIGVDLFVVLSGVGLAYGGRWEGAGRFLARPAAA